MAKQYDKQFKLDAVQYYQVYLSIENWSTFLIKKGSNLIETGSKLSEGDLLNAKIKLLEAQNKRLEMENDLLKKLEEIERRWS